MHDDDDDEIDALMVVFDDAQPLKTVHDVDMGDEEVPMTEFKNNKRTRQITGRPKGTYLLELQHKKRSEIALLNEITVCFAEQK